MVAKKITDLDPATTPLVGDELLEIVQGGVNKQVAVSDVGGGGGGGSLPPGGLTGQVLTKVSDDDGDADWATPSGGEALIVPTSGVLDQTVGSSFAATFGSKTLLIANVTANPSGIVGRGKNVSGSTTMTVKFRGVVGEDFNFVGIYATDGTKYVVFNKVSNGNAPGQMARENWSNRTTFASNFGNRGMRADNPPWYRMIYDAGAGTLATQFSFDGENWVTFESGNTYLGSAITQMGVCVSRINTGIGPSMWIEHIAFT